jgi:hypothetical protein
MRLVAHRGNRFGPSPNNENKLFYVTAALNQGYDVEIDVWKLKDKWYLGHDEPRYLIDLDFLKKPELWCHAKNLQALENMLYNNINCFWHQTDRYTITSSGAIWTFPGQPVCKKSLIVCHSIEETIKMASQNILGICSDYVGDIENVCRI